jgi:23S rRNA (adenine-N6)-dimethyltransferase
LIEYSQNFIKNKDIVNTLLSKSNIKAGDLVLDIGAGKGIISDTLVDLGAKPIPIELDEELARNLGKRFRNLFQGNFLKYRLPKEKYKVFSNIPFSITNSVIKKLFLSKENSPESAYIIMESIASEKFVGQPYGRSTEVGAVIALNYKIELFEVLKPHYYEPKSNVDTVMVSFEKREKGITDQKYELIDFIFNRGRKNILKTLGKRFNYARVKKILKELNIPADSSASDLSNDQIRELVIRL